MKMHHSFAVPAWFLIAAGCSVGTVEGNHDTETSDSSIDDPTSASDPDCTPQTDSELCEAQQANCGTLSGADNCGTTRMAVSCGTSCPSPQTCGGGGTPNVCGGGTAGDYALAADRATLWNPGMLSKGGVPSASWPVCNSTALTPLGGGADDTDRINTVIATCPVGSVVMLGSGTFTIGRGKYVAIMHGVVLRGAGAGDTVLNKPDNPPTTVTNGGNGTASDTTPVVIMGPSRWANPDGDSRCARPTPYNASYMQLLAADGVKGAYSVTVPNASIFAAGQLVLLDETSGASWQPDISGIGTSVLASPGYAVQWSTRIGPPSGAPVAYPMTPSEANNFAALGNGADAACWFGRQDRPQNEIKEVASVSGNTVTFTSPLHKTYRQSQYAELTTYTGSNAHLVGAGIEKLTLVGGGNGALRFNNTAYCWAKNIEVKEWYDEGISFSNAFRTELRDSYIHDASWPQPGGAGYALSISAASSELLIENNIVLRANKVMVARSSGSGSVVGYNYMDHGYVATNENWIECGLNASHMVGVHHVLFEGNQSFNMDSDDTHGNSTYITYFRNFTTGARTPFYSTYTGDYIDDATNTISGPEYCSASQCYGRPDAHAPKRLAGAMRYSYWMSYVGNVLGQEGVNDAAHGYVYMPTGTSWGPTVWLLGWNDVVPYTSDPMVVATALRDGNFDWVSRAQKFETNPSKNSTTGMMGFACETRRK